MNLMFWKKKPAAEDSENPAAEPTGGVAVTPPSSGPATAGTDVPGQDVSGVAARLDRQLDVWAGKLDEWVAALALRFKRKPAPPPAEDDFLEQEARGEPTPVAADTHTAEPGSNAPLETGEPLETGLLGRMESRLAALIEGREKPVLIVLLALFLVEIGYIAWSRTRVDNPQEALLPDAVKVSSHEPPAVPLPPLAAKSAVAMPPTEIELLRRKNAALQAQLDAVKNAQAPGQTQDTPVRQDNVQAGPIVNNGDLTVGSANPKATAMTLKQAIEAMNASSGEYKKTAPAEQTSNEPPR